ncbi:MAG TPA: hypothetical protein GX532_01160 [Clostridia bacterium]|jgi:hypothetical protein|nr:hypothetical protein [Clostridia bacterium]HHY05580.1 hypothetical protein [Clostridia bacterium]
MFLKIQVEIIEQGHRIKESFKKYVDNERGDMVATIGWMALTAVILVLIYTILKNWLPGFVGGITDKMDSISEPLE